MEKSRFRSGLRFLTLAVKRLFGDLWAEEQIICILKEADQGGKKIREPQPSRPPSGI